MAPYVAQFETDLGVSTSHINKIFVNLNQGYAGLCTVWNSGYREISIDPTYWNSINDGGKKQLIYHELGHCALDRGHQSGIIVYKSQYVPDSIMNPTSFGHQWFWEQLVALYVESLRSGGVVAQADATTKATQYACATGEPSYDDEEEGE